MCLVGQRDPVIILVDVELASHAAATAGEVQQQPGFLDFVPMFALMFAVAYFLLIRPQRKQAKEHKQLLDGLEKHDHIRTIGGIVGTIVSFDTASDEVVVEVAPQTHLRMLRRSIQGPKPLGTDEDGAGEATAEK